MMPEINLLNIYLSTCGVIAVGIFISFVYEYLFKQPDIKFGYSLFSPVSWGLLAAFSIPFINIVSFLIAIYMSVRYRLGFIRESNLKKLHSDLIIVPMKHFGGDWNAEMKLHRCGVCHSKFSDYTDHVDFIAVAKRGQYCKEISCQCGNSQHVLENDPDHKLIELWNKVNSIEVVIKEADSTMSLFERLRYHLSLSRKRKDIVQKKLTLN